MTRTSRQATIDMPSPPPPPISVSEADEIRVISHPTNTYKLDYSNDRVRLDVDGLMAMEQFCYKVIFTERYQYLIYNWNYGIELEDLFGMPQTFARAELPRCIAEALMQDDRVLAVRDFAFEKTKERETVKINFAVETIFGNITINPIFSYAQASFIGRAT